jgi:DNA-binding PadR family transcriptional regulator
MHKKRRIKPTQQLILLLLAEKPSWGIELLERLEARSHGAIQLNPGSLYRIIAQLLDDGLVRPVDAGDADRGEVGAPRKTYALTRSGLAALRAEAARQAEWVELARSLNLLEEPR